MSHADGFVIGLLGRRANVRGYGTFGWMASPRTRGNGRCGCYPLPAMQPNAEDKWKVWIEYDDGHDTLSPHSASVPSHPRRYGCYDLVVSIETLSPPFPKMRNRKEDANCKLPETMITNSKTYTWLRPAWFVMRASTSSCVCDGHWIGCEPARLASQLT